MKAYWQKLKENERKSSRVSLFDSGQFEKKENIYSLEKNKKYVATTVGEKQFSMYKK